MTAKFPPVDAPRSRFFPSLRDYCLGFDGAYEDYPWGETVYKVREKIFAFTGGDDDLNVTVKATQDDAEVLTQMEGIQRAAYIGRHGWISVRVHDDGTESLIRELIAASYELVAPKRKRAGR